MEKEQTGPAVDTDAPKRKRGGMVPWLRSRFLTGIVVTAPIAITTFLVWKFVEFVDNHIKPLIPERWNPETYVDVALPGLGVLVAIIGLTIIGMIAANLIGKTLVNMGDWIIGRVPLVRTIHMTLKQALLVFTSDKSNSFKEVVMVEYPRKGSWAVGFLTTETRGELAEKAPGMVGVFVPTTPNPTSGFLIFVPADEVKHLDMSVEDGAKLIVSAGLIVPETDVEPVEPREKVWPLKVFEKKTG